MAKKSLPQSSKPRKDIDEMNSAELRAYIEELKVRRDELLAQRAKRPDIDAMSDEERAAYQEHLMRRISAHIDTMKTPEPTPKPIVEESPAYHLPTKRMRKTVERFDNMTDSEQVDNLRAMW